MRDRGRSANLVITANYIPLAGKSSKENSIVDRKVKKSLFTLGKITFLTLGLLVFSAEVNGQHKLATVKLSDGVSIKIPKNFSSMSESDMWQRVSSYRKSLGLFTDPQRLVELGINYSFASFEYKSIDGGKTWTNEVDYVMMKNVYQASIEQFFDEVKWEKEEIVELGNRKFVALEFISTMQGDPTTFGSGDRISKYFYIQYTMYNGSVLVTDFSCPARDKGKWQPVANEIMSSIRLK